MPDDAEQILRQGKKASSQNRATPTPKVVHPLWIAMLPPPITVVDSAESGYLCRPSPFHRGNGPLIFALQERAASLALFRFRVDQQSVRGAAKGQG